MTATASPLDLKIQRAVRVAAVLSIEDMRLSSSLGHLGHHALKVFENERTRAWRKSQYGDGRAQAGG